MAHPHESLVDCFDHLTELVLARKLLDELKTDPASVISCAGMLLLAVIERKQRPDGVLSADDPNFAAKLFALAGALGMPVTTGVADRPVINAILAMVVRELLAIIKAYIESLDS